jgi:hypothetical protein
MRHTKKRSLSFDRLESRDLKTAAPVESSPFDGPIVMPPDEVLYPGFDIDKTESEREADIQGYMDMMKAGNSGLDHTQFMVPSGNPTIPPTTSGTAEEQSYYDWLTEGMQRLIESISPPDHPIMITP